MRRFSLTVPVERTVSYFYLGLGVANVLKITHGLPLVKAFSQLIEEFEVLFEFFSYGPFHSIVLICPLYFTVM
jgi:hypothetical protein